MRRYSDRVHDNIIGVFLETGGYFLISSNSGGGGGLGSIHPVTNLANVCQASGRVHWLPAQFDN